MSRHATARRSTVAPRAPRRVSGPAPRPVAVPAPPQQRTTGAIQTVADHHLLDTLLRSRAWIWLLAIGLGGIVAMQVSLLKLNTGISRAVESAATLERQNAELEVQVARLSSDERIRLAAQKLGLIMPDAGAVKFLSARPERDAERAASRMAPPSADALQLLANGGKVPAGTLTASAGGTAPAAGAAPVATPAATAQPVATAVPTATPTATPAPAAVTAGGQAAPQG